MSESFERFFSPLRGGGDRLGSILKWSGTIECMNLALGFRQSLVGRQVLISHDSVSVGNIFRGSVVENALNVALVYTISGNLRGTFISHY